ncbi:MAG: DNA primase [Chitinophagales bacterium]
MADGRYEDIVREIESKLDIVDIVSESCELTRKGNRYWGLCPFHSEKTPSFSVSREQQLYYCFGCHNGGNIFSFVMKQRNLEFRETVEFLAEKAGVDTTRYVSTKTAAKQSKERLILEVNQKAARFYHQTLLGERGKYALEYLHGRGINAQSVESFCLGFAPDDWRPLQDYLLSQGVDSTLLTQSGLVKRSQREDLYIDFFRNRIIYPIYNQSGKIIGFGGRILEGQGPKYLNSAENQVFSKRYNLFGLYQGRDDIRDSNEIILVEGYMDCLQLHQYGVRNAVASLGTALTREQVKIIKRWAQQITIIYDGDEAGQRETLRAIEVIEQEGMNPLIVTLPAGADPDEFIRKHGKEEFLKFIQNNRCTAIEYKLERMVKTEVEATLESNIKILWSLFPEVERTESMITRDRQLQLLARKLGLTEREVKQEYRGWTQRQGLSASIRNRNLGNRNNRKQQEKVENPHFQEKILGKLINDPQLFDRVEKETGLEIFTSADSRRLAEIFATTKAKSEPHQLSSQFREAITGDQELESLWARINFMDEEGPITARELEDFIRMRLAMQERESWRKMAETIENLESGGNFYSALHCIVSLASMVRRGQEGGSK